jgi:Fe-S cluster assembly protein SufD
MCVFSSIFRYNAEGIDVCLFHRHWLKSKYKTIVDTYFNQIANKEESLTSLNTAFANEGAYINIPEK